MTDFDVLTSTRAWCATPSDYNSMVYLRFREDGSGEMVFGYGQTIFARIAFRFVITENETLTITYIPSVANQFLPGFNPTAGRESKAIPYSLKKAEVTGVAANTGRFRFLWTMQLAGSPFPEELKLLDITQFGYTAVSPPREYFGHNENEKVAGGPG